MKKIFAISDLHGQLDNLDPSGNDIVVIAGDFAPLKRLDKYGIHDQCKWINTIFYKFTSKYPEIDFVITPGNHDLALDILKTFPYKDISLKTRFSENVHLLLDQEIEIKGLKIYGTPWVPIINYMWAFEADHIKLVEKFKKIPEKLDILITHAPPRIPNEQIDFSIQTNYGPFGSSELTNAILEKQPKNVFCGHIHSGKHGKIEFNGSNLYNVSRLNEDYCISYEPTIIELL